MSVLDLARARVRETPGAVIFAEGDDARVRDAVAPLAEAGVRVMVLGTDTLPEGAVPIPEIVDDALVAAILVARPGMKPTMAARMLRKPLFRAGALVAIGAADAMVAGVANPTRRVIEAASLTIGLADGVALPSSFFVMEKAGETPLVFADCAVNVAPEAAQLADIAVTTARSAKALLREARTAFLSFSTHKSGAGASVDLVSEARVLAGDAAPDLIFDGPLQADAALNAGIAAKKGVESDVAGSANVLIFPDLDAGNIAYKLVQELGGRQALGPFLQGFAKPVCDFSRGAGVDDIVGATLITLAMR